MKLPNLVVIGALCVGAALAASKAGVAPADDEILSLNQSRPMLTSPVRALQGRAQPELVATYEVATNFTPAQGLVLRANVKIRASNQEKDKGGLAKMSNRTIVLKASRPVHVLRNPRYGHTATADPYVYAYC